MNKKALNHARDFIQSWLQLRYDGGDIPGFVVAIAHKGEIIMNEAYGYADLERKIKMTPQHIFRIASHSKTFTATALMQLQEQGKLRIDDYVVDYLPWLKSHKDTKWQNITIRQLMSHGAGIIRDGLNADYWQLERPFPSQKQLQKEVLEANVVIENNTKHKYSNFGYSVLGMIIESVSGKAYNDYVKDHIVNALGLKNTGPEYTPEISKQIVTGYTRLEADKIRIPIEHINTKSMSAATGFYSTSEDLCAYFTAQLIGSGKLLSDESKKEMQRAQWHAITPGQSNHEDYGLGIEIEYLRNRTTFGHGGGFPGHITESLIDPKDELAVVVLTNCLNSPAGMVCKNIFDIIGYFQDNTPTKAPRHNMSALEGRYGGLWALIDIIIIGDKVIAAYPDSWQPLSFSERLEYVNDTTLKVVGTGSFNSEGELVHFNFKNGKVDTVIYNGTTLWPEKAWRKKQQGRQRVRLIHTEDR